MQPPSNHNGLNYKTADGVIDTAGTDHRDNEVRGMNEYYRKEQQFWRDEHD